MTLNERIRAALEQPPGSCIWSEDGEGGPWATSCGNWFTFTDDGPTENGAKFCLYCGKPLIEHKDEEMGSES